MASQDGKFRPGRVRSELAEVDDDAARQRLREVPGPDADPLGIRAAPTRHYHQYEQEHETQQQMSHVHSAAAERTLNLINEAQATG